MDIETIKSILFLVVIILLGIGFFMVVFNNKPNTSNLISGSGVEPVDSLEILPKFKIDIQKYIHDNLGPLNNYDPAPNSTAVRAKDTVKVLEQKKQQLSQEYKIKEKYINETIHKLNTYANNMNASLNDSLYKKLKTNANNTLDNVGNTLDNVGYKLNNMSGELKNKLNTII